MGCSSSKSADVAATKLGKGPEKKEKVNLDEDGFQWYFAIASMMNPVSLNNRGIFPKDSLPAEINDYELIFYGPSGIAAAKPSIGKSFHGVLHKCTPEEMAELDRVEVNVPRTKATAKLYDGTLLLCTIYSDPAATTTDRSKDGPPTERYIDIMIEGATKYGVKPAYIEQLKKIESIPRKQPSEFITFDTPEILPRWPFAQVAAGNAVG